jgi:glycerophosphoryl diester phosphodiesterase
MKNNRPIIIGHRGARKYAPENSMSSFKKAIELKLDGVEFDCMSTADGLPVVMHDDNLFKLTGAEISLHKTPYVDVINLDIGKRYNAFFSGEKIPTLKEVLELFSGTNMLLNIELKHQPHQNKRFLTRVVELIDGARNLPEIIISSFSRDLLYQIGRIAPKINRSLLIRTKAFFFVDAIFFANMLAVSGINPHISITNSFLMKLAKMRKWRVITWTANDPDEIRKVCGLGVDGIITDEPVLTREVINNI